MKGLSEEKRKTIVTKYCSEPSLTMRKLAKQEGVSICAVQNAIARYGKHNTLRDLPGRGRKVGASKPALDKKICQQFERKKDMSVRDCAKKCGTSIGMVQRAKARNSLKTYKKQKCPKRSKIQAESVKTRARKLYDEVLSKKNWCIIMDDETYVKMDYKTLPGAQFYTVPQGTDVPNSEKSIFCEKFGKKVLVWQAICQCGMKSSPFFTFGNLNAEIYQTECLQKRVLPLIRKHKGQTLFWPDLASCHYARSVLEWYREMEVNFVAKAMNPPNCPEIRPIERYWALMKGKLRKKDQGAVDINQFKKDWINVSKTIDATVVQNLMQGIKGKVRELSRSKDN
jgi:transposase